MPPANAGWRQCDAAGCAFNSVPGDRDPAEHKVEVALAALDRALAESVIPWMVIGGMAVIMRGGRRMTTDIDAVPGPAGPSPTNAGRSGCVLRVDHQHTGYFFDE